MTPADPGETGHEELARFDFHEVAGIGGVEQGVEHTITVRLGGPIGMILVTPAELSALRHFDLVYFDIYKGEFFGRMGVTPPVIGRLLEKLGLRAPRVRLEPESAETPPP